MDFPGFNRGDSRFLLRPVFHLLPIERQDFRFASGSLYAFVKSAAGFFAEPAALHHFFEQRRHSKHFPRFVIRNVVVDVADHVDEHIEPDDIGCAERGGLRPAHGRPGACVHFLNCHLQRQHLLNRVEHRKRANAIGDEVRRVLRKHHAFAQPHVADFVERFKHGRQSLRSGNQLGQFHVARRIEEMRARPVLLKILRAAFGDQPYWQAGSVRRDNRSRLAHGVHAL